VIDVFQHESGEDGRYVDLCEAPDCRRLTNRKENIGCCDMFGTHGPNVAASNGQAVARYVLRERVSIFKVHSVVLERPCLLSTGQSSTDSDKAANAVAILSKIAIHLSKSNFGSWGWSQRCCLSLKPQQRKKTYSWPNESIKVLYTLRLEGIGFKHRVFLPQALRGIN
jgi:hypothetical protein